MADQLTAFRLGDVRGIYPDEINEAFALSFAHAFVQHFSLTGAIATGRDMRDSSIELQASINQGLKESGIEVLDLGLCTTELGYFASTRKNIDTVIIITASHNPDQYNGFKCVLKNGVAVTFETGLSQVMKLMQKHHRNHPQPGSIAPNDLLGEYIDFMKMNFDAHCLQSGQIALNGLNGTAATLAQTLSDEFALPVTWFRREPGPIPSEGADPTKPRLLEQMQEYMQGQQFSLGVAWDGDCDRCVFFTGEGKLVPAYYVVGLMAEQFLSKHEGGAIVFDTKLCWNTLDVISRYDGTAVPSETGHAFMKRHMRQSHALYGGELASHHYFGDFFGCDSGMFAWLKMVQIINSAKVGIEELIERYRTQVCCTPEISLSLTDVDRAFAQILSRYEADAKKVDHFDGLSFDMPENWRFSLRRSKTEPLVRVNFESRESPDRLLDQAGAVLRLLQDYCADDYDFSDDLRVQ